jgi:hypothetical protein
MGDLIIEAVKVEASDDLTYRTGRHPFGNPDVDQGKFVKVYRRQAFGSWKCSVSIITSDRAMS